MAFEVVAVEDAGDELELATIGDGLTVTIGSVSEVADGCLHVRLHRSDLTVKDDWRQMIVDGDLTVSGDIERCQSNSFTQPLVRGDLRADSLTCLSDTFVTGEISVQALELTGYGLVAEAGL